MPKRFRAPQAKEGELLAKFGKSEGDMDIFYCWPENECGMKKDSRLLMYAIERCDVLEGKSLRQLLTERGYDLTTFKLSVKKLPQPPSSKE